VTISARLLRYAWASPCSALGLSLALPLLLAGGRVQRHSGVIEISAQGRIRRCFGRYIAITFGHVVLAVDDQALAQTRRHERVHVAQYERWGLLFFPAYLVASLIARARGGHYYRDNSFEREARRLGGGEDEVRPQAPRC
jgi:hypothetical protein